MCSYHEECSANGPSAVSCGTLAVSLKFRRNMVYNFTWKINLDLATKYKFLWIKKPIKTFIENIFFQIIMVASSYYILFITISIILKREFNLNETTLIILLILITVYFIISLINMNILYTARLPNMNWEKIQKALEDIGLETVFFIEKDKCLVAYSSYAFKPGRQIVIIRNNNEFLVNQKISNNYNVIFPIAPFATWRLLRKLKKADNKEITSNETQKQNHF
jgi:hypothetical protein